MEPGEADQGSQGRREAGAGTQQGLGGGKREEPRRDGAEDPGLAGGRPP